MADYRPTYLPPKSPSGMVKLFRWTALTLGIFWGIIRKEYLKERETRIREIQAEQNVFIDAKKKMIRDKINRHDMEYLGEISGMEKEPNFDEQYPPVRDEDVKKVCADEEKFIADHKDEEGVLPLEKHPESLQKLCLGEDMEPKSPDESSREPPSGKKRPTSGQSCPSYDEDDDDDDDEYEWVWTKWFSGKQKINIMNPMELYQYNRNHYQSHDKSESTEGTRDNEGWFGVEGFLTSKKPTTSGQMKSHQHHHHHHEHEHQHHLESILEPPSEIPIQPDEVEDEDETDWFWSKWFIFRRDDHKNHEYEHHLHHHHEHEAERKPTKVTIRSSKAKKDMEECPYCRR